MWRVCERFCLRPPGIKENWDDNTPWDLAQLISYENIRGYEEIELATIGKMSNV